MRRALLECDAQLAMCRTRVNEAGETLSIDEVTRSTVMSGAGPAVTLSERPAVTPATNCSGAGCPATRRSRRGIARGGRRPMLRIALGAERSPWSTRRSTALPDQRLHPDASAHTHDLFVQDDHVQTLRLAGAGVFEGSEADAQLGTPPLPV